MQVVSLYIQYVYICQRESKKKLFWKSCQNSSKTFSFIYFFAQDAQEDLFYTKKTVSFVHIRIKRKKGKSFLQWIYSLHSNDKLWIGQILDIDLFPFLEKSKIMSFLEIRFIISNVSMFHDWNKGQILYLLTLINSIT